MTLNVWMWILFLVIMGVSLGIDLGMKSHRERTEGVSLREAFHWTLVWIALALLFAVVIYYAYGRQRALEYLAGYLIEKSLSVDNMFVFLLIFNFFHIPPVYQPRVLKWGILGAIVMRFVLIFAGVALLARFHWLFYVFGAVLLYTAIRMVVKQDEEIHPDQNPLLRLVSRFVPVTGRTEGHHFFTRLGDRWAATPLFATLVVVEFSDLVFAVDSIPAVLAISRDPFIVFTSNVFAILGLRALYFLISGVMGLFRFLKFGLSFILAFIGVKMLISDFYHVPTGWSLAVVAFVLTVSIVTSVVIKERIESGPEGSA